MQTPLYVRRQLVGCPLDYASLLARINVPTLVIHGRKDCIVPLAVGQFFASSIPHAKLSVFEDSGQSPFAEEPERFNGLTAKFADTCAKTRGIPLAATERLLDELVNLTTPP